MSEEQIHTMTAAEAKALGDDANRNLPKIAVKSCPMREQQQASGVERWRHFPLNMKSCDDGEFVTAADHDAAIAAKDAKYGKAYDQVQRLTELAERYAQRAEAAEAKVAEYRDTFTTANEMRLSEVRLRHAVQQRAELAELHCTAALDRLEVANAQLAELRAERERMRNDSPYVRCLEGDGVPYVLRVGISTRNWDGSQSTHPHWHIQRLTWSEYGGPFSSPEKANEYLAGLLERNPNYYVTIEGIKALAAGGGA